MNLYRKDGSVSLTYVLQSKWSGKCWRVDYENNDRDFGKQSFEWLDTTQTQPTEAEVLAEIARLEAEWNATEYQRLRAAEYPNMSDYLDGIVKGDQAQIDKYIADCLAVKAKYPKE